jgi:hypothetical protein
MLIGEAKFSYTHSPASLHILETDEPVSLNSGPILLISSPRDVHYALAGGFINYDADSISVTENLRRPSHRILSTLGTGRGSTRYAKDRRWVAAEDPADNRVQPRQASLFFYNSMKPCHVLHAESR